MSSFDIDVANRGIPGATTYERAQALFGFTGTEEEYMASLRGADADTTELQAAVTSASGSAGAAAADRAAIEPLAAQVDGDAQAVETSRQLVAADLSSTQSLATAAGTSASVADQRAGDAETAAAQAGGILTQATTARDAAFVNANVYADIATGRAAVADLQQFQVVSGDEIIRYRRDSVSTQTEMARYPSASALSKSVDALSELSFMARSGQPIAGANLASGTYVLNQPASADGEVYRLDIWSLSATTVSLRRFTQASGQIGPSLAIPLAAGFNSINIELPIVAGQYLGIYTPGNSLCATASTTADNVGYVRTLADTTEFPTSGAINSNRIEVRFYIRRRIVTKESFELLGAEVQASVETVEAVRAAIDDFAAPVLSAVETRDATAAYTTGNFGGWAGAMLLPGVSDGTVLTALELQGIRVAAGATVLRLMVYSRQNGEVAAPPAGCALAFTQDYQVSDLEITAGASDFKSATFRFPVPYIKGSGNHLAWRLEARDAADAKVNIGMGYLVDAAATASERGWYYANLTALNYSALAAPNKVAGVVFRDRYTVPGEKALPVVASAEADISVAGGNIAVTGSLSRVTGEQATFSGTLTPVLAAAGQERIDLIVLDRATSALSLVAGSPRTAQLDSLEWQGPVPSNALMIGRARVGSASIQAVSVADWRGVIRKGSEAAMAAHIERNRSVLRKVVSKAARAGAIRLGGYGDSITALQFGAPGFEANGQVRDRATASYLTHYPSDTKAVLPVFDTGDGAGQVHTRLGWNWDIKIALDDMAGADVVAYFNYGIGGTSSQPTANNGLDPARIAFPLGDNLDLVVIAFGMNERGQSYTYANIVAMIGQFKAAGVACVVMGCPRPNANQSLSAWRVTNNALEAAAMDAGAAFISTAAIADDQTIGGMGIPAQALASANTINNGNNHPGIYELRRYGLAAVTQLGL
ncbi:SGNH/GDSL hydrolase family protein [Paracoccus nototheniae]|uniref:SGNH/GDSL hydrolase family protein n=1 Tax=Paracoccus nototheniae TaxID=2489002 RepID=A0ABW4DXJ4_9RHOB|nr:SGNH/GDSL hydrolase family protein [Paracoccus nototheniae]